VTLVADESFARYSLTFVLIYSPPHRFKRGQLCIRSHHSINSVVHRPISSPNGQVSHRNIFALWMSRPPWRGSAVSDLKVSVARAGAKSAIGSPYRLSLNKSPLIARIRSESPGNTGICFADLDYCFLEILGSPRMITLPIGEAEMKSAMKMAVRRVRCGWNFDTSHAILLSLSGLFRSHGMRAELRQGRGLVGDLAGLLVDPTAIVF
jgi:hypothetical protein